MLEDKGVGLGRVADTLVQFGVNEIDKHGVGEEDGRRIVRFVGVEIRAAGQGVRSGKKTARDVDDLEIEVRKIEQPSCLATVEVLCLTEIRQVLVVRKDLYGERGAVEVVSPGLQGADDSEEFSVVDIVVSFRRDERLREVGVGVPVAVGIGLEEDGA